MRARLWTAVVLCAGLAAPATAQIAPPPANTGPVTGTEVFAEFSWNRVTDVSVDSQNVAFGDAPFHITFSVTYEGLKPSRAPDSVVILLERERATAADVAWPAQTPPVVAVVDKLPVPLTRQTSDGPDRIKGVLSFEVFQWIVGGATLDFEAFGRRFVFVPSQMAMLKQAATDWALPGKR